MGVKQVWAQLANWLSALKQAALFGGLGWLGHRRRLDALLGTLIASKKRATWWNSLSPTDNGWQFGDGSDTRAIDGRIQIRLIDQDRGKIGIPSPNNVDVVEITDVNRCPPIGAAARQCDIEQAPAWFLNSDLGRIDNQVHKRS